MGHDLVPALLDVICGAAMGLERFVPMGPEGSVPLLEALRCLGWLCLGYSGAREIVLSWQPEIDNEDEPMGPWPLAIQLFLEGSKYFPISLPESSPGLDSTIKVQAAAAISNIARHHKVGGLSRE